MARVHTIFFWVEIGFMQIAVFRPQCISCLFNGMEIWWKSCWLMEPLSSLQPMFLSRSLTKCAACLEEAGTKANSWMLQVSCSRRVKQMMRKHR
uniref:Secreted protein n=1 Tax=Setaria viridis TaxID=4556 RepID=A0A4U6T9B8_SETVI|nr:hypothetical protein SEVIR_9G565066v2 [Setaria viridis]